MRSPNGQNDKFFGATRFSQKLFIFKKFFQNLIKNPKCQKIEVMDFGIANVAYQQNHCKSFGILEQYFLKPIW